MASALQILANAGATVPESRAYLFDTGVLCATVRSRRVIKRRRGATISLSLGEEPFEVSMPGCRERYRAAVFRPLVPRSIDFSRDALISAIVWPSHADFRAFRAIAAPGVGELQREAFRCFDGSMELALSGDLSIDAAQSLFEGIVATCVRTLPAPQPIDRRVQRAIAFLDDDNDCPLEDLARAVHLSYYSFSHLFSQHVGLSLRSYRLWLRTQKVMRLTAQGYALAEAARMAGFVDASHFYHVCYESTGVSPSFVLSDRVQIIRATPANVS